MAASGFNCIRLSWVDSTLSSDLTRIQQIVSAAAANGMKIILDHHTDEAGTPADGYGAQQMNGLWYDAGPGSDGTNGAGVTGTVSDAQFQADWQTVAQAFAGNSTVIGFDLDNEPLTYGNSPSGGVNWGAGGPNDIHAMYQTVGNEIQAIDPGALIIAEGPIGDGQNGNPSDFDLRHVATDPVVLHNADKVVYSVHNYPTAIGAEPVDSGNGFVQLMNTNWGYLETQNIAPVWVGEIGASLDGTADSAGSNLTAEQAWASTMASYLNGQDGALGGPTFTGGQQGISTDWWAWGYNPGQYPDGVLNADGSLNAAQQAVWSQFGYSPTTPVATSSITPGPGPRPGPAPAPGPGPGPATPATVAPVSITGGAATPIVDAGGEIWSIDVNKQVAVNGADDATTANVVALAFVDGKVWQQNDAGNWWSKTLPTDQWTSAASPLPVTASATSTQPAISVSAADTRLQVTSLPTTNTIVDGDLLSVAATGTIQATLGSTPTALTFLGTTPVNLIGGAAAAFVTAAASANMFTPGTGALTVTGGSGADSYVFHAGSGLLTIADFSAAKGDTLSVDQSLAASMQTMADGNGGTMIGFGGGNAIDLHGLSTAPDIAFR